jgi:alpha-ketoglutarate-dependent taurine dioxygenase
VVYFRGQQLSNERHIEFSRRFGELEIHVLKKYLLPNYPEILTDGRSGIPCSQTPLPHTRPCLKR